MKEGQNESIRSVDRSLPNIEHTHMSWPDDRAVPLAHHHVIAVLEAVRAGAVTDTLLALLKLFEQAEVARNCYGVCGARKMDQRADI